MTECLDARHCNTESPRQVLLSAYLRLRGLLIMEVSGINIGIILQNLVSTSKTKIQVLEQENDELRTVHQHFEETHSEYSDSKFAYVLFTLGLHLWYISCNKLIKD